MPSRFAETQLLNELRGRSLENPFEKPTEMARTKTSSLSKHFYRKVGIQMSKDPGWQVRQPFRRLSFILRRIDQRLVTSRWPETHDKFTRYVERDSRAIIFINQSECHLNPSCSTPAAIEGPILQKRSGVIDLQFRKPPSNILRDSPVSSNMAAVNQTALRESINSTADSGDTSDATFLPP